MKSYLHPLFFVEYALIKVLLTGEKQRTSELHAAQRPPVLVDPAEAGFKTKKAALDAEHERRKEIKNQNVLSIVETVSTAKPDSQTGTDCVDLLEQRQDFLKAYRTERYFADAFYLFKRCSSAWGHLTCSDMSRGMVEDFLKERRKKSVQTANAALRQIRATFRWGQKRG